MLLPLLLFLIALPVCAQENRYQGQTIASVELVPAADYLDKVDLSEKLAQVQPGATVTEAAVRHAIEQLYSTGRFQDVIAEAEPAPDGVALRFRVVPSHFYRNIMVTGVPSPPSRDQLMNVAGLPLGDRYSPAAVRQAADRMQDLFRTNGLYLAKITPERIEEPFQQVDISFNVVAGRRAKYAPPIVRGNTAGRSVDDIVRMTRWRLFLGFGPFREMTESRTQTGLDRIRQSYQKKDYLLAKVTLDAMEYRPAENRVVPSITIDSGPRVSVRTQGARVSRGKLRDLVPIFQEQTVDKDLLVEGKRELTEYFQSRGYFEAEVDFDRTQDGNRELILYSIFRGDLHKLVHIGISGNHYFDRETLKERMFTTEAGVIRFRRGRFSQDFLRRDANAIRTLYQQNGFRDVAVRYRTEDDYNGRPHDMAVFFDIREGRQWFVNSLALEGIDRELADQLRPTLQSSEGQPYSEISVAADVDAILSYFYNNGYPDARLDPTAIPLPDAALMDLRYVIQPGSRRYVRDVLISGLGATRQSLVLSRIRNLRAGAPLAQSSVIESQRRLYDLGIFARVDAALQNADGETDHKYVLYRFEEASRWSLNGGIGAQIARIGRAATTTLDMPAGAPGFAPRLSFGVSRNNFAGIGHTVSAQGQWAPGLRQRGVLSYLAPQFQGNDRLNLTVTGIFDDSRDVTTFTSKRREASVQLSQRLTKANTFQYRVSWRKVTVSDVVITPALIPLFAQPVNLGTISGTFIQDRRDDPVDARRGMLNTIDGAFASNFFGQPRTVFTRLLARNATYHRIRRDLVLARQLSFGLEQQHAAGVIPLPERFFAGGVASHRGFPDNQAGPRDSLTGFPLGGRALLFSNTELRFPLLGENVSAVFFHDAGNVYSSVGNISFRVRQRNLEDFDYMVHAVGFGIRYRTPVGPVRADLAWSINAPRFNGLRGTTEQLLNPDAFGPNCANLSIGCVKFVQQRISRFQFHFSLGQLF